MTSTLKFVALFGILALSVASGPTCPPGWVLYSDSDASEGGASCLYFSGHQVSFREAQGACQRLGDEAGSGEGRLVTIISTNTYFEGGLLQFILNHADCVPTSTGGTCPVYWVGATLRAEPSGPTRRLATDSWQWTSPRTPNTNLQTTANGGNGGIWGVFYSPSNSGNGGGAGTRLLQDSPRMLPPSPPTDPQYPAGCAGSAGCNFAAASVNTHGLLDATEHEDFNYVCQIHVDTDDDGVPDVNDYCPDSVWNSAPKDATFGSARNKVDANGCTRLQVDPDKDGICSSGFPSFSLPTPPVKSKWCAYTGSTLQQDNCNLVYNPDQTSTLVSGSGDACVTNGCSAGCAVGCNNYNTATPRDSPSLCSTPVSTSGVVQIRGRCNAGWSPLNHRVTSTSALGCREDTDSEANA